MSDNTQIPKVTLDSNCLMALENEEPSAPAIYQLVEFHNTGSVCLRLPAIMGSEWQQEGKSIGNFQEFMHRLEKCNLHQMELLRPPGYWDITFWDWCIWADEKTEKLEREIHQILFPDTPFDFQEYAAQNPEDSRPKLYRRWLNRKCDVLSLWSHIYYDGDIFVTSDRNFHKESKKSALASIGAEIILAPDDAVVEIKAKYLP